MSDNSVAALVVFFIFGAPITAWIVSRVLAHQERIEMIRRGMIPPPGVMHGFNAKMPPPVWGPGMGAAPGPMPGPAPVSQADFYYAQTQMRKGVRLTLIGFALVIGLGTIGPLSGISYFGPWLLGGLIPMFIGIAQVINATMHGAQIPGFGTTWGPRSGVGQYVPPPPPPSGATPPPQPPPGPYAWRPGPTPEIERDK